MATRAEQYREHLRGFLRDKEEFNFLTGVEEFPDAELDNALKFAATEWNTTPPPIGYVSVETHPAPDISGAGRGPLDRHFGQPPLGAECTRLL